MVSPSTPASNGIFYDQFDKGPRRSSNQNGRSGFLCCTCTESFHAAVVSRANESYCAYNITRIDFIHFPHYMVKLQICASVTTFHLLLEFSLRYTFLPLLLLLFKVWILSYTVHWTISAPPGRTIITTCLHISTNLLRWSKHFGTRRRIFTLIHQRALPSSGSLKNVDCATMAQCVHPMQVCSSTYTI